MVVLPFELMLMIAEHVHGEKKAKKTLIACSLVDTHWHLSLKPYVFHSILLQMKINTFHPSIDFFQANPSLAILVKKLSLYRTDGWEGASEIIVQSHIFLHLLDGLREIDSWRFHKIVFEESPPAAHYCMLSVLRPIRELQIFSPYVCEAGTASSMKSVRESPEDPPRQYTEAIRYILNLLRPFSVISHLAVNNTLHFGPDDSFNPSRYVLQHELAVHTLEFQDCMNANNFLDILQYTETSQRLESLTYELPQNKSGSLHSLTALLSSASSSFKLLKLNAHSVTWMNFCQDRQKAFGESLASASLRFLTHLNIAMPHIWVGAIPSDTPMLYSAAWPWFERLLEIFPTTAIARINMSFPIIRWNNAFSASKNRAPIHHHYHSATGTLGKDPREGEGNDSFDRDTYYYSICTPLRQLSRRGCTGISRN